jgi:glycosyltransferase EpsF
MIYVLNIISQLFCGGAEATIMNYYRNIDRSRIQFDFLVTSYEKCYYDDEAISLGARIFRRPMRTRKPISNMLAFIRLLRRHKEIKIIHIHHYLPMAALIDVVLAWLCGVPVRIVHSHLVLKRMSVMQKICRPILRLFTTHIVSCSIEAGISMFGIKPAEENKIFLYYNARDITKFIYDPIVRNAMRKSLGIDDSFMIINIGRLEPQKNHLYLLEIFAELIKYYQNVLLFIVGDGYLKETIEAKISSLRLYGKVHLLGLRNDIHDLLQAADLFVLPSLTEGLPGVVIEAQIAGLPCLLADTITPECKLTDLITFIPINTGTTVWIDKILHSKNNSTRGNMSEKIIAAGYNIKEAAKKLENFYFSMVNTI